MVSVSPPPTRRPISSPVSPSTPKNNSSVPTTPPASVVAPSSSPVSLSRSESLAIRCEEVRSVFLQVSTQESLFDPTSPQYLRMEWLVENDGAQISPADEGVLLTRYVVSLLYFAFEGDEWCDSFGFLQPSTICECNDSNTNGCYCLTDGIRDILFKITLCTYRRKAWKPFLSLSKLTFILLSKAEFKLHGTLPEEVFS